MASASSQLSNFQSEAQKHAFRKQAMAFDTRIAKRVQHAAAGLYDAPPATSRTPWALDVQRTQAPKSYQMAATATSWMPSSARQARSAGDPMAATATSSFGLPQRPPSRDRLQATGSLSLTSPRVGAAPRFATSTESSWGMWTSQEGDCSPRRVKQTEMSSTPVNLGFGFPDGKRYYGESSQALEKTMKPGQTTTSFRPMRTLDYFPRNYGVTRAQRSVDGVFHVL